MGFVKNILKGILKKIGKNTLNKSSKAIFYSTLIAVGPVTAASTVGLPVLIAGSILVETGAIGYIGSKFL